MTARSAALRRTFAAFGVHNFRLYFTGQVVSVSGTWMQRVAQSWLVLELTGSGSAVGAITAAQFLPILLLAPSGGLMADRFDKRRLLYLTQSLAGLTAATLGVLVLTDRVELWMVFALALMLGLVDSIDNPTRHAFVMEMVGRSRITSAVGLHTVLVNLARIAGPAIGGVLIVTVGIGVCFLINAASYMVFIVTLLMMRGGDFKRSNPEPVRRGALREAWVYVRSDPSLFVPLILTAVVGMFTWEFEVTLPLLARFTFAGDADTFGSMFAAMGLGAVAGGLFAAARGEQSPRVLARQTALLGAGVLAVAMAPALWMEYVLLALMGATATSFLTLAISLFQINSVPEMRGRVIGLRAVAFIGVRPIGAPIVGWVGEHLGPRFALGLGALAAFLVAGWAWRASSESRVDAPNM